MWDYNRLNLQPFAITILSIFVSDLYDLLLNLLKKHVDKRLALTLERFKHTT
jgi:hypothetical protein